MATTPCRPESCAGGYRERALALPGEVDGGGGSRPHGPFLGWPGRGSPVGVRAPGLQDRGFPWHTIREFSPMSTYVARLTEPARPDRSGVLVRTPDSGLYDVTDPRLAAELGTGLRVMRLDRGAFDDMPVSVISRSTVSAAYASLADVPGNESPVPAEHRRDARFGRSVRGGRVGRIRRPDRGCGGADGPQGLAMHHR